MWAPEAAEAAAFDRALASFFGEHGVPGEAAAALTVLRSQALERTLPAPRITVFRDGDSIAVGDRPFQVLCTPGHTDGLIVLWDESERTFRRDDDGRLRYVQR